MNLNKIATKSKALFFTSGPSIDASYGPWDNIEQYENFLSNDLGLDSPYEYTKIGVKDQETGSRTEYIYENGEWKAYIDFSNIDASILDITGRVEALEGDKNAQIANKITGSVTLSKNKLYAGQTVVINVTGRVTLPSEIANRTDKISSISISGGGQSVSGQAGDSTVSLDNVSITSTTTFSLSAHVDAPYTKDVTASATITKYCPVYIGVVNSSVNTAAAVVSAIANADHLQNANDPLTTIKSLTNKSITYGQNQCLAFICGQSGVKVKENGALVEDAYQFTGTTTVEGMTAYVYVTQPQMAGTRSMNFNA